MAPEPDDDDRSLDDIVADAESNADETTRREALEQELEDEGRSEDGSYIGDQMD